MLEFYSRSSEVMIYYLVNGIFMSFQKTLSTKANWIRGSNLKIPFSCSRRCCQQRSIELGGGGERSLWYVGNLMKGYLYFDPEDSVSKDQVILSAIMVLTKSGVSLPVFYSRRCFQQRSSELLVLRMTLR
jgi:hypothetical protein